jgi:hypothetical protein
MNTLLIKLTLFYLIFSISLILCVSLQLLSLDHWLHPFKKNSEATILLMGSFIVIAGMYYGVRSGYMTQSISKGFFILTGSWIAAVLAIAIGLVFFNGSTK